MFRKKFVSVLLMLCVLMSILSISAFADEVDVGWTDANRQEFMTDVRENGISSTDMKAIMGQDDELDCMLLNWLNETSEPIDSCSVSDGISTFAIDYSDTKEDVVERNKPIGNDSNLQVVSVTNPMLSEYADVFDYTSNICKIFMWFDDGAMSYYVGSGFLIGDDYLMTAAHCTYFNHDYMDGDDVVIAEGTYAKDIMVVPLCYYGGISDGVTGTVQYMPRMYSWCDMSVLDIPDDYINGDLSIYSVNSDWAIVKLVGKDSRWVDSHYSNIGSVEVGNANISGECLVAGYPRIGYFEEPAGCANLSMCNSGYSQYHLDPSVLVTQFYGRHGMSGGPVFNKYGQIIGVYHSVVLNGFKNEVNGTFAKFDNDLMCHVLSYSNK